MSHGFFCKRCGGAAPIGIGYVTNGAAAEKASESITGCPCGYSQKPTDQGSAMAIEKTTGDIRKIAAAYKGLHAGPEIGLLWGEDGETCIGFEMLHRKPNGDVEILQKLTGTSYRVWQAIRELGYCYRRPNSGPKIFDLTD